MAKMAVLFSALAVLTVFAWADSATTASPETADFNPFVAAAASRSRAGHDALGLTPHWAFGMRAEDTGPLRVVNDRAFSTVHAIPEAAHMTMWTVMPAVNRPALPVRLCLVDNFSTRQCWPARVYAGRRPVQAGKDWTFWMGAGPEMPCRRF